MIIIICGIIGMAICLIYIYRTDGCFEGSDILLSAVVGVAGLLAGFLIWIFSFNVFSATPIDECQINVDKRVNLIALKDNFQTEGSGFLFSTVINEELKYTYVYESYIGITTDTIDADEVYIKYIEENDTPYIEILNIRPHSDFVNWLFSCDYNKYIIYIPKGSIIENVYEIDLE